MSQTWVTTDPFWEPYQRKFWEENGLPAHSSGEHGIAQEMYRLTCPRRVLDIGCGAGQMLAEMSRLGAEIQGFESRNGIQWCELLGILEIPLGNVMAVDLRNGMPQDAWPGWPDLIVCTEVLEHLPEEAAIRVARAIVSQEAKWLAISGATPGSEGGTGHINEHHESYWRNLFTESGLYEVDWETTSILHDHTRKTFDWADRILLYRGVR